MFVYIDESCFLSEIKWYLTINILMLLALPPSSEAVGESVVNEKIFKETHFCEHFCLSGSTNQSVTVEGYSCDRS